MRQLVQLAKITLMACLSLGSGTVLAHTALTESSPSDGAVINMGPSELKLTFTEDVRLVKLEVLHLGQHAMDIGFKPMTEAKSEFVIAMPQLSPAAYTVNWAAIGDDGHTVTNSFAFTVDPSATPMHGAEHMHEDGHQHEADHDHEAVHAAHTDHAPGH